MNRRFIEEILEQPEALTRCVKHYPQHPPELAQLAVGSSRQDFRQIILTGMGSSLHACYPLWLALNAQGVIPAICWDTSELIHHASTTIDEKTLLIAVSQSGETIEIRRLAELARRPGLVISITNGLDNTLASWSDIRIDSHAGKEATVSTKTYVTTLAALHLLGAQLLGGEVEVASKQVMDAAEETGRFLQDWQEHIQGMAAFFGSCESLAFMGRGASMASVRTGALITMESSKVFCQGLSSGQFRHGPLELAKAGFKAVIFASPPSTRDLNERLLQDIAGHGATCMYVTPDPGHQQRPGILDVHIPPCETSLLPLIEIVPIQLLTIALAQSKGIEPAVFGHASKVTLSE